MYKELKFNYSASNFCSLLFTFQLVFDALSKAWEAVRLKSSGGICC